MAKGYKSNKLGTQWSQLRIDRGISFQDLAKEVDVPLGALFTYFSGEHVPPKSAILKICHYFNVDFSTGQDMFVADHEIWLNRHDETWFTHEKQREAAYIRQYHKSIAYMACISFRYDKDADLITKLESIESGNRAAYIRWVLRQHLGTDAFYTEIITKEIQEVLGLIYSEVSFDIFIKILYDLIQYKTFDIQLLYGYVDFHTFMKIYKLRDKL